MANFCGIVTIGVPDARQCLDVQPQLLKGYWVLLGAVLLGYVLYIYVDFVSTKELVEAAQQRTAAEVGNRCS